MSNSALSSARPDMLAIAAAWNQKPMAIHEAAAIRFLEQYGRTEQSMRGDPIGGDIENGIGFIDVKGPLSARSDWGMASYDRIWAKAAEMVRDGARGLLLRLDTPGGEVSGSMNLAERLRGMRAAVPVWMIADDWATSAGQLILAQGSNALADRNGMVGSIGVIMMHIDVTQMLENFGVKVTVLRDGPRKAEGNPFEALGKEAKARLLGELADFKAEFIAAVVAGRDGAVTSEAIIATESVALSAQEGLELGLIDGFSSTLQAMEDMKSRFGSADPSTVAFGPAAAAPAHRQMEETAMATNTAGAADDNPELKYVIVDDPKLRADEESAKKIADFEAAAARRAEIMNYAAAAGLSAADAETYIKSNTPVSEIGAELLRKKAASDAEAETAGHSLGRPDPEHGPELMQAAAERYCRKHGLTPVQGVI